MIRSQLSEIDQICTQAIGLAPGVKSTLRVDDLDKHSGYIPWFAYTNKLAHNITYDTGRNILLNYTDQTECVIKNNKVLDKKDRQQHLHALHNEAQEIMSEVYKKTLQVIHDHKQISQADLSRVLVGDEYKDRNYTTYTIGHMLEKCGGVSIEHEGHSKIFKYLKDVIPDNLEFETDRKYASKNEAKFAMLLTKYNIPFQSQYVIKDCCYKRPLPFDFYFIINGREYLVEIQGEQHFQYIN